MELRFSPLSATIGVATSLLTATTFATFVTPVTAHAQNSPDLRATDSPADSLWLDTLDTDVIAQDWGEPKKGRSVDNNALTLGGVVYPHGIGTHAGSEFSIDLKGSAVRFLADVGVDDEVEKRGSCRFEVWGDGKILYQSAVLRGGDKPEHVEVDLTGVQKLRLVVNEASDGIDYDHGDWGGALLLLKPGTTVKPVAFTIPMEPGRPIWTEPDSPVPAIHGPRVIGGTPGKPFLFRIPATGEKPLRYEAKGLPEGVTLDPNTGVISGTLKQDATTVVDLTVKGPRGRGKRKLVILGGKNKLAQTPQMGWNSWNIWGTSVTAEHIRAAADSFEESGLAAHGYSYINIDDGWEAGRAADGTIQINEKFGAIKPLADYVHSKGLKLGIYSSPGSKTCGGFEGSFGHEYQDAKTYGEWGIDYLKYDWCAYWDVEPRPNRAAAIWPYRVMQRGLEASSRDIFYSLCQYGMQNVWEWGPMVDANSWRTTGDITDTWSSMAGIGFEQSNVQHPYSGPGHWNDPDMLVVGRVGWGPKSHMTRLKPNEQITHITLWCLQAAPLLIGCDLTQLDTFTKGLLLNDEVLDVDQDPLGKQAHRITQKGRTEIWARPLFDGTLAVGLFNRDSTEATVTADWLDLGLKGKQPVRDLWQHKDLGSHDSFSITVPAHGAVLIKVGKPKRTEYVP